MNSQRVNDKANEEETSEIELDSLTDFIGAEDVVQMSRHTARHRIEELKEEQRLREKIGDYEDWD